MLLSPAVHSQLILYVNSISIKKRGGGQEKAVLAEELHKGPGTETQQLPGLAVPGNKMGHGGLVGLEARA